MVRNHTVAACSEVYNKSIIDSLTSLSEEPVYSTKQDIGSQKSQCRNAQAVTNHLNFCMMATTLTWIYADRLKTNPERRHKVKGRTSFAFSDIRRIIAEAALDPDFDRVSPKYSSSPVNSVVAVLLRMVA